MTDVEERAGAGVVEMDVDEALEMGGPCGITQTLLQLLFMTACVTTSFHAVGSYFTGNDPAWKCTPREGINGTMATLAKPSLFCEDNNRTMKSGSKDFYERCNLHRDEWTFVTHSKYSFVTEFDLVCNKAATAAFTSGSLFIGGLLGCLISGIVGDTYGRKSVMISTLGLALVSSLACSYSASVWQLTASRVILGGAQMACFSVGYTALLEFIPPSQRTLCSMIYSMMFCLSQLFFDVGAYFVRRWRVLQFWSSFACIVPFLFYFFIPNSPRWLVSSGSYFKAKGVLEKLAKYNGNELPNFNLKSESDITEKIEEDTTNYTYLHLFKTTKVFIATSVLSFLWITCALLYFAIALESSSLGGNMYQAFAFTCVADMPSYFVALIACSYIGRKRTVLGSLGMAGLFVGTLALVPQTMKYRYAINITLSMVAKFFTTNAFNGIFLWTFEIYPTCIRSQGAGYCIAWERFGAFCAPFMISLLQQVNYRLPFVVMSLCAFVSAAIGLVLPETLDCPTREKYEDFFIDVKKVLESTEASEKGFDNQGVEKCDIENTTTSV